MNRSMLLALALTGLLIDPCSSYGALTGTGRDAFITSSKRSCVPQQLAAKENEGIDRKTIEAYCSCQAVYIADHADADQLLKLSASISRGEPLPVWYSKMTQEGMTYRIKNIDKYISTDINGSYAQRRSIPPLSLVGTWSASERLPTGEVMLAEQSMTADKKFTGSVTVEGKQIWNYAGSWDLDEDRLTWHYEYSSRPLADAMKIDEDDIISVNQATLVLVSHLTGKRHEFKRVN